MPINKVTQRIKQLFSILSLTLGLSLISGCALVMNGTTQRIPIKTQPVAVHVYLNGDFVGVTPLEIEVSRKHEHELKLKFGVEEKTILLIPEIGTEGIVGLSLSAVPAAIGTGLTLSVLPTCGPYDCGYSVAAGLLIGLPTAVMSSIAIAVDVTSGAIYTLQPSSIDESF